MLGALRTRRPPGLCRSRRVRQAPRVARPHPDRAGPRWRRRLWGSPARPRAGGPRQRPRPPQRGLHACPGPGPPQTSRGPRPSPCPVACAMPATRLPSYALARLAETRTVEGGTPLRAIAERLRPPLFEPGSVVSALRPAAHQQLGTEAKRLATVWQRSRAHGEGRTGSWSLRSQQRRGLALPRTHAGFPTMHHVFLTRPDGTTAAQRFCGQKPRSMCAAIVASVALAPAPLRPPRKS